MSATAEETESVLNRLNLPGLTQRGDRGRPANRIINEVRGINRVTYDITSESPGTIEWA